MARSQRTTCIAAAVLAFAAALWAARSAEAQLFRQRAQPLSHFLVDIARDHGLTVAGKQTPADVAYVRAFLELAAAEDPQNVDALVWLVELAAITRDPAAEKSALERLLRADPDNEVAHVRWAALSLADLQTVEQRAEWLRGRLPSSASPNQRAYLLVQLARLALYQLDEVEARRLLTEAQQIAPDSRDVHVFALQFIDPNMPPAGRVRVLVDALRTQPARSDLAWLLAENLDTYGFYNDAWGLYEYAQSLNRLAGDAPLTADEYLTLGRNALGRGDEVAAVTYAQQAAKARGGRLQHALAYYWLNSHLNHTVEATTVRQTLSRDLAKLTDPGSAPLDLVSQAAWFYCWAEVNPERALLLAEEASARAPADAFVQRVLGWALALNNRPEDAQRVLSPLAKRDPLAAYQLARLYSLAGDTAAAANVVRSIDNPPRVGQAAALLAQLGLELPAPVPPEQMHPDVQKELKRLTAELFTLGREPRQLLMADMRMVVASCAVGEPWVLEIGLRNTSQVPVALGPDGVLNPVLVVSITMEGDRTRRFEHLMTISFDGPRTIPPGGLLTLRRTIDVGPPRLASQLTPQHDQRITVEAILDPQRTQQGEWQPSPSGGRLPPLSFQRSPASATREAQAALLSQLRGDSPYKLNAIEVCAQLLGEAQRAASGGELRYRPAPIAMEYFRAALLAMLRDPSAEARARALESLRVCGLDAEMLAAAEANLTHERAAVRALAVRLLGRRGAAFAERAQRIATTDADPHVRDVAALYAQPPASE